MRNKGMFQWKTALIAIIMMGVLVHATLLCDGVFAMQTQTDSSLPERSGKVVLDKDPEDGYEGDYVLIYNNNLENPLNIQATGILSNIDTNRVRGSRSRAGFESGQIDYHPEVMMLKDGFEIPEFQEASPDYQEGDEKIFRIFQPKSGREKDMDFTLLYKGINCYVWIPTTINFNVLEEPENQEEENTYTMNGRAATLYGDERDYPVSFDMAKSAGEEFDSFYDLMTDNFGSPADADGTGKVSLLMYDIQDGNSPSAYIGGFFDSSDLSIDGNATSMLHIDTYPSMYANGNSSGKVSKVFPTMVHEFQHLLNYSRYFENVKNGVEGASHMNTWLNEAMSMAAEEMVFPESAIPMRRDYYNRDYYSVIRNGKSLIDFDNSLESYSLSSLFAEYLKSQTGSYEICRNILNNYTNSEKEAIEAALVGTSLDGMSFEEVVAAYKIALVMQDEEGVYGFKGNSKLDDIQILNCDKEGANVSLSGGASIVIKTKDGAFIPGNGAGSDIRFVGIKVSEDGVSITERPDDKAMRVGESFEVQAVATIGGEDRNDIQWSSSDLSVAEGMGSGNVWTITAKTVGTTEITASCDTFSSSFLLTIYRAPEVSDFEGIRMEGNDIYITSNNGMYAFERMVNGQTPTGMTDGLEGYNIYLETSVDVDGWMPIGTNAKPFKGSFYGNGFKIILKSLAHDNFQDSGIFGVNAGTIEDTIVDLRGTISGWHVGALVGQNHGIIRNAVVNIDDGVTINGKNPDVRGDITAGGVAGANWNSIENVHVINHGTIGSGDCNRAGGVTGFNQGVDAGDLALIHDADVYNNGTIISNDDTGGMVGLLHGWNFRRSEMSGELNLIITKNGNVTSTVSGTASVGGAIGYAYDGAVVKDAVVTVRMDGKVLSAQGRGISGGVLGETGGNHTAFDANTTIIVTLGPDAEISQTASGFGLICGDQITPQLDKWIYAVPYENTATPLPDKVAYTQANSKIKKIEYPKEGVPSPSILVTKDSKNPIVKPNIADLSNGIFIPKIEVAGLTAASMVDSELFDLDTFVQTLCAKAEATSNYFDFNLVADGIPITVPAYLKLENEHKPTMTLDITGTHVKDTKEEAESNPVTDMEKVTVLCENGRVVEEDWSLKKLQDNTFKNYKPNQFISTNTLTKKEFTLNEEGVYEISATGTAIFDGSKENRTKYVKVGMLAPSLVIEGAHLTDSATEEWTNLKPSKEEREYVKASGLQISEELQLQEEKREEIVTVEAINTQIEKSDFKKEAIPYEADPKSPKEHMTQRTFALQETGRYKIIGKGIGISKEIVKYVNIDVDAPLETSLKDVTGTIIQADTDYKVVLPVENIVQSPIHAEFSIDGSGFAPLTTDTIRLPKQNARLDLKTVDAATNESNITTYTLQPVTSKSSGKSRGTKTVQDGLPYYYKNNDSQNGTAPKIFIGIADKIDGVMNYIAPADKKIYFIHNPKDFKDIWGHWAKAEIDFVTEREIFVGTYPQIFEPDAHMTRGMFAAVIGRLYERSYKPVIRGLDSAFGDVPKEYYYADYINWAADNRIILGVGENRFEPERSITREEMGAIMYRFAKFLDLTKDISKVELTFADTDMISFWAIESSKYCQATGLIVGRGLNHFEPEETAERSEVSAVIHRFVEELLQN